MKKYGRKHLAAIGIICLLSMTACGSEGGRSVNSTNAVDNAIQGQIAAEEKKTAVPTTEVIVTEANTKDNSAAEVNTTESTTAEVNTTESNASEAATEKKAERTAEDDKKLLDDIHAAYQEDADLSVDIDLTAMDSDMVYATVYQMIYGDPDAYVGKTFKAAGTLTIATSSVTDLLYPYVLIKDALACCQQGLEFQWGEGVHTSAEDFAEEGSEIEVTGTFETYMEEGDPNLYTRLKDTNVKVISEPEKHEIKFTYD